MDWCDLLITAYANKLVDTIDCCLFDSLSFISIATNICALYCQAKGQSFYYRHADRVIDGTPCEVQSSNMCVNGVCEVSFCIKDF